MTRWQRFRLAVARFLLEGTEFTVARSEEISLTRNGVNDLRWFVQKSGSLTHPRRVSAKKKIERKLDDIASHVHGIQLS